MNQDDVIRDREEVDALGQSIVSLKPESIDCEHILKFVHYNHDTYFFVDRKLILDKSKSVMANTSLPPQEEAAKQTATTSMGDSNQQDAQTSPVQSETINKLTPEAAVPDSSSIETTGGSGTEVPDSSTEATSGTQDPESVVAEPATAEVKPDDTGGPSTEVPDSSTEATSGTQDPESVVAEPATAEVKPDDTGGPSTEVPDSKHGGHKR